MIAAGGNSRPEGRSFHHPGEDALVAPPLPSAAKGLRRTIFLGCIVPPQTIAVDEDNAARHSSAAGVRIAVALGETRFIRTICASGIRKRLCIDRSFCEGGFAPQAQVRSVLTPVSFAVASGFAARHRLSGKTALSAPGRPDVFFGQKLGSQGSTVLIKRRDGECLGPAFADVTNAAVHQLHGARRAVGRQVPGLGVVRKIGKR